MTGVGRDTPRLRSGVGWLWLGPLLLLAGCEDDMTWARLGMAGAPLAYGLALAPLLGLAKSWSFRPPALQPRRGILVVPALILAVAALVMISGLPPGERTSLFRLLFSKAWLVIAALTAASLAGILALIWRLWFALAPRSSIEGAALLGSALFFLPGLLLVTGQLPNKSLQDQVIVTFVAVCLYGMYPGPIVVFLLQGEAWLARRKHTAGSR